MNLDVIYPNRFQSNRDQPQTLPRTMKCPTIMEDGSVGEADVQIPLQNIITTQTLSKLVNPFHPTDAPPTVTIMLQRQILKVQHTQDTMVVLTLYVSPDFLKSLTEQERLTHLGKFISQKSSWFWSYAIRCNGDGVPL